MITQLFKAGYNFKGGFPGGSVVKNPPANAGDSGLIPGLERFPWRIKWQPTLVFQKSHGQRSLMGHSLWRCKESDTTELLNNSNITLNTSLRCRGQDILPSLGFPNSWGAESFVKRHSAYVCTLSIMHGWYKEFCSWVFLVVQICVEALVKQKEESHWKFMGLFQQCLPSATEVRVEHRISFFLYQEGKEKRRKKREACSSLTKYVRLSELSFLCKLYQDLSTLHHNGSIPHPCWFCSQGCGDFTAFLPEKHVLPLV